MAIECCMMGDGLDFACGGRGFEFWGVFGELVRVGVRGEVGIRAFFGNRVGDVGSFRDQL